MPKKILQVNFKYSIPADALLKAFMGLAKSFADVKGLEWKIWTYDANKKMVGGFYLFKDQASIDGLLKSKLVSDNLMKNPNFSDIDVKVFDVIPEPSKITRAPI